jgi:tRNA modification GTPase
MLDDTIIAISTPLGFGALGIVRMSGHLALPIAKKIFKPTNKKQKILSRHPILGYLYNAVSGEQFEEAYLTFFSKPYTYTRENVVEISCHGSPVILEEAVRLGIKAGARHASPGEFTLRAYLNGRLDLLQAQAINDLITASSLRQAKISFRQMGGSLSKTTNMLRQQIIQLLSQIEASLEFPDEGLSISPKAIAKTLRQAEDTVDKLISSYDLGKTLSEGLMLAIAGRTNVGKSTLFNALLEKNRAIVTPFPGTTRDYLQETFKIRDALFTLTDMAGIDTPIHPIEREGINRGKKLASSGDGILLVLDASRKESRRDIQLMKRFENKKAVILFNKSDLPVKMDIKKIQGLYSNTPSLAISALKGTDLDRLKDMIFKQFVAERPKEEEVLLHLRQKLLFEDILSSLSKVKDMLQDGYSEEIYVEEIRKIIPLIGQLTGEIQSEDVLTRIFSRFCVGK